MPIKPAIPGATIDGKYRLADRIGGGGMGDVFRAENIHVGRLVAIKFLHAELAENVEIAQRFFQEARAVNRIKHQNIVDVIDAGQCESGPYIVMEHLDGESVGAVLMRHQRFDVDAAIATMIPVLEALEAAHRASVIHRDLKPENIFIALDAAKGTAVVRLLDFGIAKVFSDATPSPRTRTGVVFGTPDYLSPEQATGDQPLDGRSDLFAVGILLFEMLTGVRPFRAATAVATAFRVVHAEAPTMASVGVTVDPRVERIVQHLLQKDPARRHPTAREVIHDLEAVAPDSSRRAASLGRLIGIEKRLARLGMSQPISKPRVVEPEASTTPVPVRISSPSIDILSGPPSSAPSPVAPTRRAVSPVFAERVARDDRGAQLQLREPDSQPFAVSEPPERAPRPPEAPLSPRTPVHESRRGAEAQRGRSSAPPIRPFPARFAGRFSVRGPVLRAVDRAIADAHGRPVRDQIVAGMPPRWAADFANDSINSMVSYDLEELDAYLEIATAIAVGDPTGWRSLGRRSVRGELAGLSRSITRSTDNAVIVMRRSVQVWQRLFSFGTWRVVRTLGGVGVQLAELDPASLPLRLWLVGLLDETANKALGPEARVVITLGEMGFTPELACEIS